MLYKKVTKELRHQLNSELFEVGDKLPTEKELMDEFSVSRITIRTAIDELVNLGLVEKKQGAGTFLLKKEAIHTIQSLRSTAEYMQELNKPVHYQVIKFTLVLADAMMARHFQQAINSEFYYIRRVKYIDGYPCIVEDSYMPVALFPDLNISTLRQSKYDYIEKEKGLTIEGSKQSFFAVMPESEIAELLSLDKHQPIIKLTSLSNLQDGRYFDYSIAWFKPDAYDLQIYLRRNVSS